MSQQGMLWISQRQQSCGLTVSGSFLRTLSLISVPMIHQYKAQYVWTKVIFNHLNLAEDLQLGFLRFAPLRHPHFWILAQECSDCFWGFMGLQETPHLCCCSYRSYPSGGFPLTVSARVMSCSFARSRVNCGEFSSTVGHFGISHFFPYLPYSNGGSHPDFPTSCLVQTWQQFFFLVEFQQWWKKNVN